MVMPGRRRKDEVNPKSRVVYGEGLNPFKIPEGFVLVKDTREQKPLSIGLRTVWW